MKVTLLNKDEMQNFFTKWGNVSAICYNTNEKYAERIGKHCLSTGHFSGSRPFTFIFKIEDISRSCANQLIRHKVGTELNQRSQRYVDEDNFRYFTPPEFNNNELSEIYHDTMKNIDMAYQSLKSKLLISGMSKEQANENARYVLPNATHTSLVMSFTLEALINLTHKRLCTRSQWEIYELTRELAHQVVCLLPELKPYLVPICDAQERCDEKVPCKLKYRRD